MDIALSKTFPFKREVSGGCRTSILTDRIEFIPYEIGEEFPEKKFNDCSKYTILTPDQSITSSSGKWIVKKKSDTNSHPEVNGYVKTTNLVTLNGFSTSNAAETNNNSTANASHIATNNKVNNNNVINNNSNVNGGGNEPMAPPKIILYPDKKVQLEWNKVTKVGAGLINMGNTCYLNSVLQCLSYCSPLVNHLLYSGDDHSAKCKLKSFCMVCEFQQHLQRLYSNTNSAIKPSNIYSRLKSIARHFHPNRQEDAHEFLRYVLDHMWKSCLLNFEIAHNSVKLEPRSKETTVINKIFGGYHRSQVTCSQCKEKSNTYDYFMDFILDIKDAGNLEDAFRKFTQPELLQNENAYKCPNCKKKVAASKRFTIFRPPNVATVQFKRFDYNRIYGGKITKKISYPETFNIRPYMSDSKGSPIFYKLNAVLVHLGSTSNSGHYYCYVKSSNGLWYLMDDDRVIQVNLAQVLDQQAYILFYVKVSAQNSYSTEIAKAEVHQALSSLHNNQPKTNGILNACRSLTVYPNGHLGKSQDQLNNKQLNGDRNVNLTNSLASVHSNGNKNSTATNSFFDGLVDKSKSSQFNSPIKPQHSLVNYDEDSSDDDDSSTSSPVNSTPSKSSTPTSNHTNGLISKKAEKRLMKLKKKNKKKRKRKKYSEELEWVERTKETVEKERRIKHQI